MTARAKFISCALVVLVTNVCFQTSVLAEYQGPGAGISRQNVRQIVLSGEDGLPVSLRGRITQKVGREKYLFTDETANIRLHIDDTKFPASPVTEETRLEIFGSIEKEFVQDLEIDVSQVRVLP